MRIMQFPNFRQGYGRDCGAQVVQAVLTYYDIEVRLDAIMKIAGTTKEGTPVLGIMRTLKKYKLKYKLGRLTIGQVKKYIDREHPVILLLQAWGEGWDKPGYSIDWENDWEDGHYAIAIGYDDTKIYFEDPSSIYRTYLTFEELKKRWHDMDTNGKKYINYGIVVSGKKSTYHFQKIIHMD